VNLLLKQFYLNCCETCLDYVGFEVLAEVVMKSSIFSVEDCAKQETSAKQVASRAQTFSSETSADFQRTALYYIPEDVQIIVN
jgi:hypothetical protein